MNLKATNKNKWKTVFGWVLSLLLLFTLTFLAVERKANLSVNGVKVNIMSPSGQKNLITQLDIEKKFQIYLGYDLSLADIKDVKLIELEKILAGDERVKEAEIFIDGNNNVNIDIKERKVVVRVHNNDISYYLDSEGNKINVRNGRAIRVPIATGDLPEYDKGYIFSENKNNLKDIFQLALKINEDEFLTALIEQIDIDNNGNVAMIPKVGKERITLVVEDLDHKFFNLKTFYKEGLPLEGWSKYKTLNLDYKGLVTVTKNKE